MLVVVASLDGVAGSVGGLADVVVLAGATDVVEEPSAAKGIGVVCEVEIGTEAGASADSCGSLADVVGSIGSDTDIGVVVEVAPGFESGLAALRTVSEPGATAEGASLLNEVAGSAPPLKENASASGADVDPSLAA